MVIAYSSDAAEINLLKKYIKIRNTKISDLRQPRADEVKARFGLFFLISHVIMSDFFSLLLPYSPTEFFHSKSLLLRKD